MHVIYVMVGVIRRLIEIENTVLVGSKQETASASLFSDQGHMRPGICKNLVITSS